MNGKKKKYKISIKSEQNYFNFRRRKNYPASLFSFCQCQHWDHLGVPVLKATHGESAADVAADSSSAWNPMGGGDGGRCSVTKASKISKMADFSAAQQQYLFCYEYKNSFKRSRVVSITIRFSAKHLDVHCSSSPAISIFNKQIQTYHQQLFSYFPVQSDQSADFFSCQFLQTSSSFRFLQLSPHYFHFSLLIVCEQYSHDPYESL